MQYVDVSVLSLASLNGFPQAEYRRSTIVTRLVIHVKDTALDVSQAAGFLETSVAFYVQ